MNLILNGEKRQVDGISSVQDLLATLKIDHKILVVEVNRAIIDRDRYTETLLHENDRIEIVHFVGGG